MQITIKNYEILNIYNSLNVLASKKLPISVSWSLTKNINGVKNMLEIFLKAENSLIAEYAIKKDNVVIFKENGQPEIQPKYQEAFIKEHNELLHCENEVTLIPINLSGLLYTHIDGVKTEREIEPSLLLSLGIMIKDDLEE